MNSTELLRRYADGERDFCDASMFRANLRRVDFCKADFHGLDLREASLFMANLPGVDLRKTDLRRANMCLANLREANLVGADLRWVDLCGANLRGAKLRGVDLYGADLDGVDLRDTDLSEANLHGTNLCGANLNGADLTSTCLDPMVAPNAQVEDFEEIDGGWCSGYRTKNSPYMSANLYVVGEYREARIFSTADDACHPGIYVAPTTSKARLHGDDIVSVIFRPWECHKAGRKWRVRWLIVWSDL